MTEVTSSPTGGHPTVRDDLVFRSLGAEWVVYDPRTQNLHVLNTTAAIVWTACDGSKSIEDIAREVGEVLVDAPSHEVVCSEVREAIEGFRREQLLA